jgi:cold shock CspA family protein
MHRDLPSESQMYDEFDATSIEDLVTGALNASFGVSAYYAQVDGDAGFNTRRSGTVFLTSDDAGTVLRGLERGHLLQLPKRDGTFEQLPIFIPASFAVRKQTTAAERRRHRREVAQSRLFQGGGAALFQGGGVGGGRSISQEHVAIGRLRQTAKSPAHSLVRRAASISFKRPPPPTTAEAASPHTTMSNIDLTAFVRRMIGPIPTEGLLLELTTLDQRLFDANPHWRNEHGVRRKKTLKAVLNDCGIGYRDTSKINIVRIEHHDRGRDGRGTGGGSAGPHGSGGGRGGTRQEVDIHGAGRGGAGRGGAGFAMGTAKRWNDRGFCFITPEDGSEDVFCHFSSITDGDQLSEGARVEFKKVYDERRGSYRAENVTGGIL